VAVVGQMLQGRRVERPRLRIERRRDQMDLHERLLRWLPDRSWRSNVGAIRAVARQLPEAANFFGLGRVEGWSERTPKIGVGLRKSNCRSRERRATSFGPQLAGGGPT
jgi:hypothetical protein